MRNDKKSTILGAIALLLAGTPALADDAKTSGAVQLSPTGLSGELAGVKTEGDGWLFAHKPKAGVFEAGLFAGAFFPSSSHNLRDPAYTYTTFDSVAPELGFRLGYLPFTFGGFEFEGMGAPVGTKDGGSAGLAAVRLHAIAQLPLYSVVPFAVLGAGWLYAKSDRMGADVDPALHFGAGVKLPIDDFLSVRLDVRDNLTQKVDAKQNALTHHAELLLGVTLAFEPRRAPSAPLDGDGDGVPDTADKCPTRAARTVDGCPAPKVDTDGDGVTDDVDDCRRAAGPAPTGCPVADCDRDGVADAKDRCPSTKGTAADGCLPVDPDGDKDGFTGTADKCPDAAETVNGFQDQDGCPDELPKELAKFNGVLGRIRFANNSAKITADSKPVLDDAAATLKQFVELRVLISGHTDDVGKREANVALSKARADAVKAYLVAQGVDSGRIETRGAGPDEPVVENKGAEARAKNRRIEFKVLTGAAAASTPVTTPSTATPVAPTPATKPVEPTAAPAPKGEPKPQH